MNILLIFFALPIATILISIILERMAKSPILVSSFVFAVFLIVTFTEFNINFLIATIVYTIIAFLTAWITRLISFFFTSMHDNEDKNINEDNSKDKELIDAIENLNNSTNKLDAIINRINIKLNNRVDNDTAIKSTSDSDFSSDLFSNRIHTGRRRKF